MGGGVSSLPAEVTLAEAKELAGARWQPAWEEKFAEAKISRDEAVKCWKESKAAISEALYEKLHGADRSGVAEAQNRHVDAARLLVDNGAAVDQPRECGSEVTTLVTTSGATSSREN